MPGLKFTKSQILNFLKIWKQKILEKFEKILGKSQLPEFGKIPKFGNCRTYIYTYKYIRIRIIRMNSGVFYPDVAAPYARGYWDAFRYDGLYLSFSGSNLQKKSNFKKFQNFKPKNFSKKIPKNSPKILRKFDNERAHV